jgi:Rho termination factor, N-terminal domain
MRGFLADSAYATLGMGTTWVEFIRSVDRVRVEAPRQVRTIGREAPKRLAGAADRSISSVRSLPDRATREFDLLASRGRDLVGAIRGSTATREAVDRARTARSRIKAASTSVSRAAESAVQATERAATTIVADRTEPNEHREIRVEPAEVQVKPASAQVRTRPTKAPSSRRRMPTPYEERTLEELQERAKELGVEGRSSMSKDELITALRKQRTTTRRPATPAKPKPVQATEPTAAKAPQTGPYEERTLEELQDRAKELGIEGRSSMSKDELITALREQR